MIYGLPRDVFGFHPFTVIYGLLRDVVTNQTLLLLNEIRVVKTRSRKKKVATPVRTLHPAKPRGHTHSQTTLWGMNISAQNSQSFRGHFAKDGNQMKRSC